MTVIGILAILLMVGTVSSQSYVKKASALFTPMHGIGSCPAGKVRDWAGICFNKSEAKACLTCEPGSAAAAEKPEAAPKVETNRDLFHKEVEPSIKQGQELGSSQIKVENQHIDTGTLHTKESARELEMASQAKVEHAPTTTSGPPPTHTTSGGHLENAPNVGNVGYNHKVLEDWIHWWCSGALKVSKQINPNTADECRNVSPQLGQVPNPSPEAAKALTDKSISICREILTKSSEAGSTASPSDIEKCKAFFMVR